MEKTVGIDLGTTYTVVAILEEGRPKVIPNAEGQHLTPSVVAFAMDGSVLVGEAARIQAAANAQRTIASIKRHMGSNFRLSVDKRRYSPQEISSFILQKVKADAEAYLGQPVPRAVITVPAYFNDLQRQATREAGGLAGLDVIRIINEPTAAALAYGLEREDAHTVMIWDLGGGTFDVSILDLGEGIFQVRAVAGDSWLGGDDIDQRVMDYLSKEYMRITGLNLPTDPEATQLLKEAAEKAKRELSYSQAAPVQLPPMPRPGFPSLEIKLTRGEIEGLLPDLLQRMTQCTQQALCDAELSPQEIHRVILVGGATRMPAVRRLVRSIMGKEPYRYIDPDEAVAMGAAIHAAMLAGEVQKVVLLDVLPLSLGLETQGGLTARIIPRNTPLPASEAHIFTTASDDQTSMDIHILQGERELAQDNISLGEFRLEGIPPAPKGVLKVEVAFHADVDGIVHISATELMSEHNVTVKLASTKLLDHQEIDHLALEALQNAHQDGEIRQRIEATIEAENLLSAAETALKQNNGHLSALETQQVRQVSSQIEKLLVEGSAQEIKAATKSLRQLLEGLHSERLSLTTHS